MRNSSPLVINWHLSEVCNYRCRYCYATWSEAACLRELVHSPERTADLLGELYRFFRPGNRLNPLADRLTWSSVRLNLAGGEPLLHATKLPAIVDQARALGFEVSMISNGSQLDDELLDRLAPSLSWLGISIDSARPLISRAIGRIDRRGRLLDLERLATSLQRVLRESPGLRLKINTVVNRLNHDEDLGLLIQRFDPDRWKVLRMLPVVNEDLVVSDQQFADFIARHSAFTEILCAENHQDMRESYLMVDPHGRFFQNGPQRPGQGYAYSAPILEVGVEAAFAATAFEPDRFSARYVAVQGEGA